MITIIKDVDLYEDVSKYDVTLLAANIYSTMKDGLQCKVKRKYCYVYRKNIDTKYGDYKKLGTILECKEENKPTFCLCYIIKYPNARPDLKKDNLEYDSLEKCLTLVNILYKNQKVALPYLGCEKFDGNGDKDKVMEIINKCLTDVDVYLYDYEQLPDNIEKVIAYYKGKEILKEKGFKEYNKYLKEIKQKNKNENNGVW